MLEKQDNYNVGKVIEKDKNILNNIKVDENQVKKKKKKKLNEIFDFKKSKNLKNKKYN